MVTATLRSTEVIQFNDGKRIRRDSSGDIEIVNKNDEVIGLITSREIKYILIGEKEK